jgi:alpha-ketoglutarate-dependent taurine dioxygenase
VVEHLIEIHDALAHAHRWHPGDLLIVDNTRTLHGRNRTAVDCERKLKSRFGWLRDALPA